MLVVGIVVGPLLALAVADFISACLDRRARNAQVQQQRQARSVSPDQSACRSCGRRSLHNPGCSYLDRMDLNWRRS